MSKRILTKLNEDLKLAGYKKQSCQSYVRAQGIYYLLTNKSKRK
jgi:hypothetical protein